MLSLFLSTAFAATLNFNGKPCGEIESIALDKANVLSVKTLTDCGVAPVPTPVPIPEPPKCPASTICFDKGWPTIAQAVYSMKQGQVMSFKIKTGTELKLGRIFTMYTTGDTGARQVVISTQPASFEPVSKCIGSGLEAANIAWNQGGTGIRGCNIPLDSVLYINVKFTNCEEGKICKFYFGSN